MVLVLDGEPQSDCPINTESLYSSHPVYRETASNLLAIPKRVVGPEGLLYVLQREFAATVSDDENVKVIGSDDSTTCIIVIVRHSMSGAIALGHFDGAGTEEAVFNMIDKVQKLTVCREGMLEFQLIGGYTDAQRTSEDLFFSLMSAFHKHPLEIALTLACVGPMNTDVREGVPWPILYGVGVIVKTGETFPATFPERGPEVSLRSARHLCGGNDHLLDVYDPASGLLTIGPFDYVPLRGAAFWQRQDDRCILENMSTSPLVEPPHFVAHIKATLGYMLENPRPALTVFGEQIPRCFRKDGETGLWVSV